MIGRTTVGAQWEGTGKYSVCDKAQNNYEFSLGHYENHFKDNCNLTKRQIIHDQNEGCWDFYLKAYVFGTDPAFKVILCTFVPNPGVNTLALPPIGSKIPHRNQGFIKVVDATDFITNDLYRSLYWTLSRPEQLAYNGRASCG